MNIFINFNPTIGSCFIIVLIAIDYLRKYNTDSFQRRLMVLLLGSIFTAMVFDYISLTLERYPGENVNKILYYTWSVYLIARNCCFYFGAVFIDYFAHENNARTRKLSKIINLFLLFYILSVLLNIRFGYYFYISRDNAYMPGMLYILQIFLSYFPILIIMVDIGLAPKNIKSRQILLTIIFVIISAIGAAIDIVFKTTNIIWPCVTAGVLYMYFFIIRTDSKIDNLTGIGNRSSFNEYVKNILYQAVKKEYTFILIDIEQFSEINSLYGHSVGDNALCDIAFTIKSCIRNTDFAARLGSDEFIIVTTGASDVRKIIDRINNTIDVQNKKDIRPYKIYLNYGYDVYKRNFGWQFHDFLMNIEYVKNKDKELRRKNLEMEEMNIGKDTVKNS